MEHYYQILVDRECLYLCSCSTLVLYPIFSPVDMAAVKRQHATEFVLKGSSFIIFKETKFEKNSLT